MPNYTFRAINENGAVITGDIEAESPDKASSMLAERGYIPTKVKEQGYGISSLRWSRILRKMNPVKITDLILFTKQFRSLFKAGVPIVRSLQVLQAQTQDRVLKEAIGSMLQSINQGFTLTAAMEKHDTIFSPLYCSMIRAGEMSGSVPESLERLIYIIEHESRIKSDIKSALQYPMIVTIALVAAFFVLLTFVVPQFVEMFSKAGIVLPLPTKIAMMLYQFLSSYWYLLLGGVIALFVGLKSYLKTEQGHYVKDTIILRLPILGPLFVKAAMSRFASIFGILQSSGVPVMTSMKILSDVIGNKAISREFDRVREQIQEGRGIAAPLGAAKYFPPMVVDMVAIGEETGNIEDMLKQVTLHYDDEVSYAVKRLSDLIGPVLIVGLAAVVGFFAMAIFLPMWDLTKLAR
ncbi:MAG: type II secretion system F family protein [Deltaproteobacteria bacterium]|nr:type II secretion system F family protein [Deltaproteobacteria bacterium]